jgi:hypothetical protein
MIGCDISSLCPEISTYNDIYPFTKTDRSTTKHLPPYFSLPNIGVWRMLIRVSFVYISGGSAKSYKSNELSSDSSELLKLAFPCYRIPSYAPKIHRQ